MADILRHYLILLQLLQEDIPAHRDQSQVRKSHNRQLRVNGGLQYCSGTEANKQKMEVKITEKRKRDPKVRPRRRSEG
jgi:hypothetical protein